MVRKINPWQLLVNDEGDGIEDIVNSLIAHFEMMTGPQ